MWWSGWSSRSSNVPVDIEHAGGTGLTREYVDQSQNAGDWNILGTYNFEAGNEYRVTIIGQPYPTSTCADALKFEEVAPPANRPPVAEDDTYNMAQGSIDMPLDVLENDSDPDPGDSITITLVGTPDHGGTAVPNATNDGIIYTPDSGYEGVETFSYTIEDSSGESDSADVTVTIDGTNDPPVAEDDGFTVNNDDSDVPLDVLVNDSDPDPDDTITISLVGTPDQGGTAAANATNDGIVYSPNAAFTGTETFTYTIEDSEGLTDVATVTITVEDQRLEIIIDNGDPETSFEGIWNVSGGLHPYEENSVWSRDGDTYTWTFTPPVTANYEFYMWWSEWPSRSDSVPVKIIHANGEADEVINQQQNAGDWYLVGVYRFNAGTGYTVTITGQPYPSSTCADAVRFLETSLTTNSPPVAQDDSYDIPAGSTGNALNVMDDDSDPDSGDTISITAVGTPNQGGTAEINETHDGLIYSPAGGFLGTETFTYTIEDNHGASDQATVTINVTGTSVNNPPEANDDPFHVEEDSVDNILLVLENDSDPDIGDVLTITTVGIPDQGGTVEINDTNTALLYSPLPGFTDIEVFTYTIQDDHGATAQATVVVTVNAPGFNNPPTAVDDPFEVVQDSIDNLFDVLANDSDPDIGATLSVISVGTLDHGGTAAPNATNDGIVYSPAAGFSGIETFLYTIEDDQGATAQATVTVTVRPPVMEYIVDNGDPGTSFEGTWAVSGGSLPYGANSLWGRDGDTYTWTFTPEAEGWYNVFMCWSGWPSRTSNAQVDIQHRDGPAQEFVNQQEYAGSWVLVGTYQFAADVTYSVTITGDRYPTSTCADAIRVVNTTSIPFYPPNAGNDNYTVTLGSTGNLFPVLDNDTDPDPGDTLHVTSVSTPDQGGDAIINGDGTGIFYTPEISFTGTETFTYTVTDSHGATDDALVTVTVTPGLEEEDIYICYMYAHWLSTLEIAMQGMGITQIETRLWRYINTDIGKQFNIHTITDMAGLEQALKTPGAHVFIAGHANYGLGPIPATNTERSLGFIDDIYTIDDPRILNISSPFFNVSLSGLITGQAYPNWLPVFQDGTSGIMPFGFYDPDRNPPHNYLITYRAPGSSTHYPIETVHNSAIIRFPDTTHPAWYSPTGGLPDPNNPAHRQYFITLPLYFISTGDWNESLLYPDSIGNNCLIAPPGSGNNIARWSFTISDADTYKIYGWWPTSASSTTAAPYIINHSGGSAPIFRNQAINGAQWNELGEFSFTPGEYSVELSDNIASGTVIADAIRVQRSGIAPLPDVLEANFYARPLSGDAPLTVRFSNQSTGDVTGIEWSFGDGGTNVGNNFPTYIYNLPGTYSVTMTVYGPMGSSVLTKVDYITVGAAVPPTKAEFSVQDPQVFDIPGEVEFRDRSAGNIVSWDWDFGDGGSSDLQRPVHVYTSPNLYTVSLTVIDSDGFTSTETKVNLIRASIFDTTIDNIPPTRHYGSKTILFRNTPDIAKEELRYDRLFYESCSSGVYYLDTVAHGKVFYTLVSAEGWAHLLYLEGYLQGLSDEELWEIIQDYDSDKYDYYDFTQLPGSLSAQSAPYRTIRLIEPLPLNVETKLSNEQTNTIYSLESLFLEDTFIRLQGADIFPNKAFLHSAIYSAMKFREEEAVAFAVDYIRKSGSSNSQGEWKDDARAFYVAKEILRVFPETAMEHIFPLYEVSGPKIRGRIVRSLGSISGYDAQELLFSALEDQRYFENDDEELNGIPMRVCDLAYNQLVLRYRIKGVLRNIAPMHKIDVRDYHIEILKNNLFNVNN